MVLWQRGSMLTPVTATVAAVAAACVRSRGLVGRGGCYNCQHWGRGLLTCVCVCVFCSKVARRSHHSGCAIRRACPSPGTAMSACVAPCYVLSVYIQLLPLTLSCSGRACVCGLSGCCGAQFCEVCHSHESEKRRDPVNVLLVTWVGVLRHMWHVPLHVAVCGLCLAANTLDPAAEIVCVVLLGVGPCCGPDPGRTQTKELGCGLVSENKQGHPHTLWEVICKRASLHNTHPAPVAN